MATTRVDVHYHTDLDSRPDVKVRTLSSGVELLEIGGISFYLTRDQLNSLVGDINHEWQRQGREIYRSAVTSSIHEALSFAVDEEET